MDLLQAKEFYEKSVRVLAASMSEIVTAQMQKVMDDDEVMLDHLSEMKFFSGMVDDKTPISECLELLKRLNRGFTDIEKQAEWNNGHFKNNDCDEALISEMIVGFINCQLTDELAQAAKEIAATARQLLGLASPKRTEKEYKIFAVQFIKQAKVSMKKNHQLVKDDPFFLPNLYLSGWFRRKYFEK